MKWWPASLPASLHWRLAAAFVAAVATVFALHVFVTAADRRAPAPAPPPLPSPAPSALADLGLRLVPLPGPILLASRFEAVAPDTAPVIEVLADGGVALRRPPNDAPGAAAILLPARSLAGLGPVARGTLLELLGCLVAGRPVPSERIRVVDLAAQPGELTALLAWVP